MSPDRRRPGWRQLWLLGLTLPALAMLPPSRFSPPGQALEALDEAGYVNIVGLRGGYNMWNRTWDAKLRRRNLPGNFEEEWQHGADGCGVHATGASFQNQDAFQYADWKDETDWIDWR